MALSTFKALSHPRAMVKVAVTYDTLLPGSMVGNRRKWRSRLVTAGAVILLMADQAGISLGFRMKPVSPGSP